MAFYSFLLAAVMGALLYAGLYGAQQTMLVPERRDELFVGLMVLLVLVVYLVR